MTRLGWINVNFMVYVLTVFCGWTLAVAQDVAAPNYLNRKYSEISWLMSHNSHSYSQPQGAATVATDLNHVVADQNYDVARQLSDGIRVFKLPVHPYKETKAYIYDALKNAESRAQTAVKKAKTAASNALKKLKGKVCKKSISVAYSYPCPTWKKPLRTCSGHKEESNPLYSACETAFGGLQRVSKKASDALAAVRKRLKLIQGAIAKFDGVDDNNYAWVCHGIIKGDWEKVRDKPGEWIKSKTGLSIVSQIVKYQPLPFVPCLIDGTNIKMVDLLRQFKTFLDNNGEEVLTFYLDNQNGISRDMIINAFNKGIVKDMTPD